MNKFKNIQIEYERLQSLFSSVDPTKAELVDNLLNEAAFMKAQLEQLKLQIKSMELFKFLIKNSKTN